MTKLKCNVLRFLLFVFLLSYGSFYIQMNTATAEELPKNYGITLVKYQLSENDLSQVQFPMGEELSDAQRKDAQGKQLVPMAGVSYRIVQVAPTNSEKNPFSEVVGFSPIMVTTDVNGSASIALPEGLYQVTEQTNAKIQAPAKPIIVQLPQTRQDGQLLDTIYIYPKSSIVNKPTDPSNPKDPNNPDNPKYNQGTRGTLPDTSGSLGDVRIIYYIVGLLVTIGLGSLFFLKPKRY